MNWSHVWRAQCGEEQIVIFSFHLSPAGLVHSIVVCGLLSIVAEIRAAGSSCGDLSILPHWWLVGHRHLDHLT